MAAVDTKAFVSENVWTHHHRCARLSSKKGSRNIMNEAASHKIGHRNSVPAYSLAGAFVTRWKRGCNTHADCCSLELIPITKNRQTSYLDPDYTHSAGSQAWAALHERFTDKQARDALFQPEIVLQCREVGHRSLRVSLSNKTVDCEMDIALVGVLARVLVQWTLEPDGGKPTGQSWTITLTMEESSLTLVNGVDDENMKELFAKYLDLSSSSVEIVEMMDRDGKILGKVPRNLVHEYNLLHRGVGVFITRDVPLQLPIHGARNSSPSPTHQPDLYCHRRTSTKRIFPDLYDMFVGGVALAGEDSRRTALREVGEELGLAQGNIGDEAILTCVVCTGYNRCVVDLYCYVMNTMAERVSWQAEEVAWGDFVPFNAVQASVDLSIQRLVSDGSWPGRYPPIQSSYNGVFPKDEFSSIRNWDSWDYVPDCLLVWEAWLRYLKED